MTQLDSTGSASEAKWNDAGCRSAMTVTPPVAPRIGGMTQGRNRWGVILAGGEGARLRSLTRLICGDERPKQFCPLFNGQALLEQTLQRSELSIPREQILVSLTRHHRKWYLTQSGLQPFQRVVQPINRGTAPPILHSLMSILRLDAHALIAIVPCDHHYSNEGSFTSALECAFETAAKRPDSVVLLGAPPDYPEVEYGWIELGAPLGHEGGDLFRVRGFHEKPAIDVARRLLAQGSVWNTFVMVGHVQCFLQIVQRTLPDLVEILDSACMWAGEETRIAYSLYKRIPSVSFSHQVLAAETSNLVVLRLDDIGWSDLGDPGRAVKVVRNRGYEEPWINEWSLTKGKAVGAAEVVGGVA
jgi:mannose-1-phosphate guanylyltransferase